MSLYNISFKNNKTLLKILVFYPPLPAILGAASARQPAWRRLGAGRWRGPPPGRWPGPPPAKPCGETGAALGALTRKLSFFEGFPPALVYLIFE